MSPDAVASDLVGSTISHYRVEERIGAGGMGVVYRARDLRLGRDVALKILPPGQTDDPARRKRFVTEARAASALNHPGIVTIYDLEVVDGRQLIAMEWVEGKTLRDLLDERRFSADEVVDLGAQVADALAAAHRKGILHRDLKPSNLLVTPSGRVKVLDFGLAKLLKTDETFTLGATAARESLTADGVAMGTLGYMSPEQAKGEELDGRSDLYSLGAVLYEMASGEPAFAGDTPAVVYDQLLHHDPPPIPGVSEGLAAVLARALRKDRADRYASSAALRDDLRRLQTGSQPAAARARARRHWPWVAALAVLVVAVGIAWQVTGSDRPAIQSIAVLPLENLSRDVANEYFADGMTEALITDLGRVGALKVIARHSVMRFKGTKEPLAAIARQLNVQALLVGSVIPVGDQVTVTLQLVDARDEKAMWSERFDRNLRDILVVQNEVARAVASGVRAKLSPEEATRIAERREVDPEAYRAYLEGRYFFWQMTPESTRNSVSFFRRSIAEDPGFAPAHAGLVEALDLLTQVAELPIPTHEAEMRSAAEAAVQLDPDLADAHNAMGIVQQNYLRNLDAAGREFQRALELNPSHLFARVCYAQWLNIFGRHEEALQVMLKTVEIDPFNAFVHANLLGRYLMAGRSEDGIAEAERLEREFPETYGTNWVFYWVRGILYDNLQRHVEATRDLRRSVELAQGALDPMATLAAVLLRSGHEAEARPWVENLEAESRRRHVPACLFAGLHVALRDRDRAFEAFERSVEERDWRVLWIANDPDIYETLHDDPRWARLLERIGVPEGTGPLPERGAGIGGRS